MPFKLQKESKISQARLGMLKTKHGIVPTPFFMPIATRGVVKGISSEEVREMGADIILANTYHLMVKPGKEFLTKVGGLHKFMKWDKPILTDSGGFQVFSLSHLRKINDKEVVFKDPSNGATHTLTPEESIRVQKAIGSDIMIALDECTPYAPEKATVEKAVERTIKWARRCYKEHQKNKKGQLLFVVGQGDRFPDLRLACIEELKKINFDGFAYGGMAPLKTVYGMLEQTIPAYPENKPRYLMGVGYPDNIVESVKRGIDMFDCVIPTREGRHGRVFVRNPRVKLGNKGFYAQKSLPRLDYQYDKKPLAPKCSCPACRTYTRSYIDYLFRIGDYLGPRLVSMHNIQFYLDLMREIRSEIKAGRF